MIMTDTKPLTGAEVWLPVLGYEGLYEVSSRGRVRSLDRITLKSNGMHYRTPGRILRPYVDRSGYLCVHLSTRESKRCHGSIHRLMCESFRGAPEQGQLARHLDDVRQNNVIENLYWGTLSDNGHDAVRNGRNSNANKHLCRCGLPYDEIISDFNGRFRKRTCSTCRRAHGRIRSQRYRSRKRQAA